MKPQLQNISVCMHCFKDSGGRGHTLHLREYFIDMTELRKLNGKRSSGLTRFNGKIHLSVYCIEDKVRQNCQGNCSVES